MKYDRIMLLEIEKKGVIRLKNHKPFVTAIILSAGSGSRMNLDITKQRITLLGESILHRTVRIFAACPEIDSIIVACREDEIDWAREELHNIDKTVSIIKGGKTRAESSFNAFLAIAPDCDYIAIHDGARCLVTEQNISDVVRSAYIYGAATAGTKTTDTVKICADDVVVSTIPRDDVFLAHTPQVFSCDLYKKAINSLQTDKSYTDDNMLVEGIGGKIYTVDTGKYNIKITTADDLALAEYIIEGRKQMGEIRVGHGYDVHRLVNGRKLIIGGVEIPHEKGLLGHSDADVLTHAIIDALLGACALGDIGRHFPDSSETYKDISSLRLLEKVALLLKKENYSIVNIDATLVIQKPKIAPYVDQILDNLSKILDIKRSRINIKATTEEGLGFTGSEDGAAAYAVATVKK